MFCKFIRCVFVAALVAWAGCETIERAETTKAALEGRGVDPSREDLLTNAVLHVEYVGTRLPEFVAFAYTNRPSVRVAELAVSNAIHNLRLVWADGPFMPQIGASGGYKRSTQNHGTHFGSHSDGDPYGDVSLDILVCDWGRTDAKERAAREDVLKAQQNLRLVRLKVFEEVACCYFQLRQNDALLQAAITNQAVYAEHLEQAELRYENQEVKKLDVLKAQLDLADAFLKTVSASNDVVVAEADLLSSMGLSGSISTRDEILPADPNSLGYTLQELDESEFDVAEAVVRARTGSPLLMAARARVRAAIADVDYAIADLYPELSAGTTIGFTDRIWNWSWAASAAQSIFTGWRKTTAVDRAVTALEMAEAELDGEEKTLAYNLRQALATRDNARASLFAAVVEVVRAKENLDAARAQYREGDVSRTDFSDAVSSYTKALGKRITAFYEGQMAEASLMRLTGTAPIYVDKRKDTKDTDL